RRKAMCAGSLCWAGWLWAKSCVMSDSFAGRFKLIGEITDHAIDGVGRSLAQAAYRGIPHDVRQFVQQFQVPCRLLDECKRLGRADPAWRALTTRLVMEEAGEIARSGHSRVLLRQNDDRGRADEAAVGLQGI